jgi:hypothetical protein
MAPQSTDWRHLAEQLSKEKDLDRVLSLVDELNRVLDHEQRPHQKQYQPSEGHYPPSR